MLENIPTKSLPRHGGTATTVMVILDYDTLVAEVNAAGIADTSTGEPLTAGQARRLACQADILPAVLDGKSEILDVGHLKRLVTDAIRKALNLRDRGCTEIGCTMPAEFCEAHHIVPWSRAARPASRTASSSAPSTTTAPTTPPGSLTTTPTARPASPDGSEPQRHLAPLIVTTALGSEGG